MPWTFLPSIHRIHHPPSFVPDHASSPPCTVAELLRLRGVRNVIFWAEDPSALLAAQFAGAFFGAMGLPRVTVIEAYTIALYSVQVRRRLRLRLRLRRRLERDRRVRLRALQ